MDQQQLTGDSPESVLEILTSYLDGEVSVDVRNAIEKRLVDDADYRDQLVRLEQTWQLLDQLPTATPDASFTRSTIAMVAVDARREVNGDRLDETPVGQASLGESGRATSSQVSASADTLAMTAAQSPVRSKGNGRWWMVGLAAIAVGFMAVYIPTQLSVRAKLKDLPVADSLGVYQDAKDVEFLKMLDDAGLFQGEVGSANGENHNGGGEDGR